MLRCDYRQFCCDAINRCWNHSASIFCAMSRRWRPTHDWHRRWWRCWSIGLPMWCGCLASSKLICSMNSQPSLKARLILAPSFRADLKNCEVLGKILTLLFPECLTITDCYTKFDSFSCKYSICNCTFTWKSGLWSLNGCIYWTAWIILTKFAGYVAWLQVCKMHNESALVALAVRQKLHATCKNSPWDRAWISGNLGQETWTKSSTPNVWLPLCLPPGQFLTVTIGLSELWDYLELG